MVKFYLVLFSCCAIVGMVSAQNWVFVCTLLISFLIALFGRNFFRDGFDVRSGTST